MPGVFMSISRKEMPSCGAARLGADQAEHAVGVLGVGGPDLGAVDDIVVAVPQRIFSEARSEPEPGSE